MTSDRKLKVPREGYRDCGVGFRGRGALFRVWSLGGRRDHTVLPGSGMESARERLCLSLARALSLYLSRARCLSLALHAFLSLPVSLSPSLFPESFCEGPPSLQREYGTFCTTTPESQLENSQLTRPRQSETTPADPLLVAANRCRAKWAHVTQSRPDSRLGLQVKVLKYSEWFPPCSEAAPASENKHVSFRNLQSLQTTLHII